MSELDCIIERLDEIELILGLLVTRSIRTYTALKEIKNTMATQADVDAVTQQLEGLKTEVAKIGADLVAFIAANPSISLADLQAKATEVGNSLQAVDDLLPEQTPPA